MRIQKIQFAPFVLFTSLLWGECPSARVFILPWAPAGALWETGVMMFPYIPSTKEELEARITTTVEYLFYEEPPRDVAISMLAFESGEEGYTGFLASITPPLYPDSFDITEFLAEKLRRGTIEELINNTAKVEIRPVIGSLLVVNKFIKEPCIPYKPLFYILEREESSIINNIITIPGESVELKYSKWYIPFFISPPVISENNKIFRDFEDTRVVIVFAPLFEDSIKFYSGFDLSNINKVKVRLRVYNMFSRPYIFMDGVPYFPNQEWLLTSGSVENVPEIRFTSLYSTYLEKCLTKEIILSNENPRVIIGPDIFSNTPGCPAEPLFSRFPDGTYFGDEEGFRGILTIEAIDDNGPLPGVVVPLAIYRRGDKLYHIPPVAYFK